MKDISLTEAYFLCAVQEKGKLFGSSTLRVACLMAAVLYEMEQQGLLLLHEKELTLVPDPEITVPYFRPVYEHLKEMDSTTYKHVMQDYSCGWTDYRLNALANVIGTGLAERGLVTKAKLGLFNGRTYFMPHRNTLTELMVELETELLYTAAPTADLLLWILLEKGQCIPGELPPERIPDIQEKIRKALLSDPKGEAAKFRDWLAGFLVIAKANTAFIN